MGRRERWCSPLLLGGLVDYQIGAVGFEALGMDDMGEGCLVLSQPNERGKVERIAVSREQLIGALGALEARYGAVKNTEPREAAVRDL